MNREVVWFSLPGFAILRQIGGTISKAVERIFSPILLLVLLFAFEGFSVYWIITSVLFAVFKSLPVTLIGDSVTSSWMNMGWLFVLGFLQASPSLIVGFRMNRFLTSVWASVFSGVAFFLFGMMSNIAFLSFLFPWKLCEFFFGAFSVYPFLLLLNLRKKD